jgi:transposase
MPYSTDLRLKIIRACDQKIGSQRQIAELFGVSKSFVEKLLRRRRTTGQIAALPHGGGRRPSCDTKAKALLRKLVQQHNDATLEELCEMLHKHRGITISVPTMSRLLKRENLPVKKSRFTPRNKTPKGSSRQGATIRD